MTNVANVVMTYKDVCLDAVEADIDGVRMCAWCCFLAAEMGVTVTKKTLF